MFLGIFKFWYKKLIYKVKFGFLFKYGVIVREGKRYRNIDIYIVCLVLSGLNFWVG